MLAKLYLDENTTVRLIEPLTALGHDTVSANDLGHKGRIDADQLLIATGLDRILLTYDRDDFRLLHEAWLAWSRAWIVRRTHAGIIVLHPAPNVPLEDAARAVDAYLSGETATMKNRLRAPIKTACSSARCPVPEGLPSLSAGLQSLVDRPDDRFC